MKITKAIIPVAGYGTRFLPITKTINKSMLPVLNRPLVDYIVADCEKAGITEIIFVVLPGERQLREYYTRNEKLENYLLERQAQDKYELIANIHKQANFKFVEQPQDGRYGTAIPVLLAKELIDPDDQFLVLMGDDFVYRTDGGSETADLISTCQKTNANAALACTEVTKDQVHKYSMVTTTSTNGQIFFKSMIEKPQPSEINSSLVNVSKYVFDYAIFEHVKNLKPNPQSGEYYLTDAVNSYANARKVVAVHTISGQYLDGGNLEGWLEANQFVAHAQGL